jgi:phage gp29-like protein
MAIIPQQLIKWALDEKYPYHWGAMMTIAVVTSRLRECEKGNRAQWVDMLSELREADGHAHAVLCKRFTKVSSTPWEIVPAKVEGEAERANAELIASFVTVAIERIPRWKQHVHGLCWAGFSGASAREIMWRKDPDGVFVDKLLLVHSRRIGYGDDFVPYITNGSFLAESLKPSDYPGKFILNIVATADESPTRTGLGRVLAYWMAFKRFDNRESMNYIERFGKPFPIAKWKTGRADSGVATEEEQDSAKELVQDVGRGSQPGWAGPDTIDFNLVGPTGSSSGGSGENVPHKWHIELCNSEISKIVAGGDLSTESQASGSRALGDSQSDDAESLHIDDAGQLDETITNDLVKWIVLYNFGPDAARKWCPRYHTIVEKGEDTKLAAEVLDLAHNKLGLSIGTDFAHQKLSIPKPAEDEEVLDEPEPQAVSVPVPLAAKDEDEDDEEASAAEKPTTE